MPSQSDSRSTIWKFTITPWQPTLMVPAGAHLIHASEQNGEICFWAEVDPDAGMVLRNVMAVPTGGYPGERTYVGTAHLEGGGGELVFHVYDGGEV